jgi:hypothetical protein
MLPVFPPARIRAAEEHPVRYGRPLEQFRRLDVETILLNEKSLKLIPGQFGKLAGIEVPSSPRRLLGTAHDNSGVNCYSVSPTGDCEGNFCPNTVDNANHYAA